MARGARALALVIILCGCTTTATAPRPSRPRVSGTTALSTVGCSESSRQIIARTDSWSVIFAVPFRHSRTLRFPWSTGFRWTHPRAADGKVLKLLAVARCQDGDVVVRIYGESRGRTTLEAQLNPTKANSMAPGFGWKATVRVT